MDEPPTIATVHALMLEQRRELHDHIEEEHSIPARLDALAERVDRLERGQRELQAGQRVIAAGHVSLTDQMAEATTSLSGAQQAITSLQGAVEHNLAEMRAAMDHARDERRDMRDWIDTNNRATQATLDAAREIRDAIVTVSTLTRLAKWSARHAAPLLASGAIVWGVAAGWAHEAGGWLARWFTIGGPPK